MPRSRTSPPAGLPPEQRLRPHHLLKPPPSRPQRATWCPQLQRLGDLHTQGAITDEEFTAAKAKLLGG